MIASVKMCALLGWLLQPKQHNLWYLISARWNKFIKKSKNKELVKIYKLLKAKEDIQLPHSAFQDMTHQNEIPLQQCGSIFIIKRKLSSLMIINLIPRFLLFLLLHQTLGALVEVVLPLLPTNWSIICIFWYNFHIITLAGLSLSQRAGDKWLLVGYILCFFDLWRWLDLLCTA